METKQQRNTKRLKSHNMKVFQVQAPIDDEVDVKRYCERKRDAYYKKHPELEKPRKTNRVPRGAKQ